MRCRTCTSCRAAKEQWPPICCERLTSHSPARRRRGPSPRWMTTRTGSAVLETLTSMFNPLPAIALMPLSLLWFGLGTKVADLRDRAFRAVAHVAQHVHRVRDGPRDAAQGGAQPRPRGMALRRGHPAPRSVPAHPHGREDRLGVCLEDGDRSRDGVRRRGQPGRAGLVLFRWVERVTVVRWGMTAQR